MKKIPVFIFLTLLSFFSSAQDKSIELQDVWASGEFFPEGFYGVKHLKDGDHYSKLGFDRTAGSFHILKYHYENDERADTIFKTSWLDTPYSQIRIQDYSFTDDGDLLMLKSEGEGIYRYSEKAKFLIYNLKKKKILPVHEWKKVMYATISPKGKKVAYVYENDMYFQEIEGGGIKRITNDGKKNHILNGFSDWVHEEEFTLVQSFQWSPEGEKIAYYKFNEADVKQYQIPVYNDVYPEMYTYKYPKSGEGNSKVSIHIYHLDNGKTVDVNFNEDEDIYVPRIKWTADDELLSFQKLNRHQNKLWLYFVDAASGVKKLIYTEENPYYIDVHDNLTFLDNNDFIWTSEKDGYNHLYLVSGSDGKIKKQLTSGSWDVTEFYGYDEGSGYLYFQSSEVSPIERHVYRVSDKGKRKQKLSTKSGVNSMTPSENFRYFILENSSANSGSYITLHVMSGKQVKVIESNEEFNKKLKEWGLSKKEFFTFEIESGEKLNGWMIKPFGFDDTKKYPVLMTVYGGPGSQTVTDEWGWLNFMYYQYLAQEGYVVVSVDNRGTGARGQEFKKSTYLNLGKKESADQHAAAKYLGSMNYIDKDRIGIFGWSYGGYMSLLCLLKYPETFSMAVSVAPVTDWRFYDNIYTERFMRTPAENPEGYKESSVLTYANNLEGDLLLVHGTFDDNVHPQNSMELIREFIRNNKKYDSEFYPNKAHGISGGLTRLHLFSRITDFIKENL